MEFRSLNTRIPANACAYKERVRFLEEKGIFYSNINHLKEYH